MAATLNFNEIVEYQWLKTGYTLLGEFFFDLLVIGNIYKKY